ncbi:MAG: CYTH domain-containing protein [Bacteroidales bacterium]|nr:CYTH domain-containing protein [Bacteroidales bacterium]
MLQEIERKFLVNGDFRNEAFKAVHIVQGYLSRVPERVVRIRIKDQKGFITIKGKNNASGATRFEWEKEIPVEEAKKLLELCEPGLVDKTRYLINNTDGKHTWEVDVYHGRKEGIIIAEIELGDENEAFDRPSWLGEEVTGDQRYYNSNLI